MKKIINEVNKKIAIIGLGYVGLPLAVEFGKLRNVIGYDISNKRITELKNSKDQTLECNKEEIEKSKYLQFSNEEKDIENAKIFIITVPTPIDSANQPDLKPLIRASELVGKYIKNGDIIIYESTVYPGATEEICVPILEKNSKLKYNLDFYCGYSPERINPGDKEHTLKNIKKITSGSTPEIAEEIDLLYQQIIIAGTHKASSIKVAEAAKVIENTQRDLNIALMNELSIIFDKLDIDTLEVIEAAKTKWNFLAFKPGLVGGHCIGVDPYYLTHKAQEVGYHSEVILAGRRINDSMAKYVVDKTVKLMVKKGIEIIGSEVLILGVTFKENCTDIRNSKVLDIIKELENYNIKTEIYDPWININNIEKEIGANIIKDTPKINNYSAIIIAVSHNEFIKMGIDEIKKYGKEKNVIFDIKGIFEKNEVDGRL